MGAFNHTPEPAFRQLCLMALVSFRQADALRAGMAWNLSGDVASEQFLVPRICRTLPGKMFAALSNNDCVTNTYRAFDGFLVFDIKVA